MYNDFEHILGMGENQDVAFKRHLETTASKKQTTVIKLLLWAKAITDTKLFVNDIQIYENNANKKQQFLNDELKKTCIAKFQDEALVAVSLNQMLKSQLYSVSKTLYPFIYQFKEREGQRSPRHILSSRILDSYLRAIDKQQAAGATRPLYNLIGENHSLYVFVEMIKRSLDITNQIKAGIVEYKPYANEIYIPPFLNGRLSSKNKEDESQITNSIKQRIAEIVYSSVENTDYLPSNPINKIANRLNDSNVAVAFVLNWVIESEKRTGLPLFAYAKIIENIREENRALYFALQASVPLLSWCSMNIKGSVTSIVHYSLIHEEDYIREALEAGVPLLWLPENVYDIIHEAKKTVFVSDEYLSIMRNTSIDDKSEHLESIVKNAVDCLSMYKEIENQSIKLKKDKPIVNLIQKKRYPMYHLSRSSGDFKEYRLSLQNMVNQSCSVGSAVNRSPAWLLIGKNLYNTYSFSAKNLITSNDWGV